MTEQEFFRQIWRPYDTVTLEGGITGNVLNVCFPTRSVCIAVSRETREWFKCELIIEHTPRTGNPDDLSTIADLRNKLDDANMKIENQKKIISVRQDTIKQLEEKLNENNQGGARVETLLKALRESLVEKEKRVRKNLETIAELDTIIDNFYKTNK